MARMLALFSAGALLAQSAHALPQFGDDDAFDSNEKVWAAVAFINQGESTPIMANMTTILTPEGAQQMKRQGEAFRGRYLNGTERQLDAQDAGIEGIDRFVLDNYQIRAYSTDDEWLASGATAFFQGLYPPQTTYWNNQAGGIQLSKNFLVNSSFEVDYPMDGYQYAYVRTFGMTDPQSVSLQGSSGCTAWSEETTNNLPETEQVKLSKKNSDDFYQRLFSTGAFADTIPNQRATLGNAYEVYEFAKYMYTHNGTIHGMLDDAGNANGTMAQLEKYAYEMESAMTGLPSEGGENTKKLYTVAGRTLAARIHAELVRSIATGGLRNKMSILFGSHRPMMSFFSLAGLNSSLPQEPNNLFNELPAPGSAMIFELVGRAFEDSMPDLGSVRVRFAYRPSADTDVNFQVAEIFKEHEDLQRENLTIPWREFSLKMMGISVKTREWCDLCQPVDLWYCDNSNTADFDGDHTSSSSSITPAVAGVLGATLTIAFFALLALILLFVFNFRLHKKQRSGSSAKDGGFQGQDKKPDDTDVLVGKNGAQKPRVGSWELKDDGGTTPGFMGAGIVTDDFRRREEEENDGEDRELEREPTQVREAV